MGEVGSVCSYLCSMLSRFAKTEFTGLLGLEMPLLEVVVDGWLPEGLVKGYGA